MAKYVRHHEEQASKFLIESYFTLIIRCFNFLLYILLCDNVK